MTEAAANAIITALTVRGVGHTTAMLRGAIDTGAIVVIPSQGHLHALRSAGGADVDTRTITDLVNGALLGQRRAVLLDHVTTMLVMQDLVRTIEDQRAIIRRYEATLSGISGTIRNMRL